MPIVSGRYRTSRPPGTVSPMENPPTAGKADGPMESTGDPVVGGKADEIIAQTPGVTPTGTTGSLQGRRAANTGPGTPSANANPNQALLSTIVKNQAMAGDQAAALSSFAGDGQRGVSKSMEMGGGGIRTAPLGGSSGAAPGAQPAGAGTPDQMWEDIMAQYDASGKRIDSVANAYESNASRRASELARGSATGGGFAAGMAQASMSGLANRQKLGMEHDKRGLDLRMTQLNNMLKVAEAAKDRQQAKDIQNMIDKTQMDMTAIDNGLIPSEDGSYSQPGAGGAGAGGTGAGTPNADPTTANLSVKAPNGQNGWSTLDSWDRAYGQQLKVSDPQAYADVYAAVQRYIVDYFGRNNSYPDTETINRHVKYALLNSPTPGNSRLGEN